MWFCKYGGYTVISSLLGITQILATVIGKSHRNMVIAPFWEWATLVRWWFLPLRLVSFTFRLIADIHLSDIGRLYWEKLLRNAPCRILIMSVKGVQLMFIFTCWLISVPIGCRHPVIKYWRPLHGKKQWHSPYCIQIMRVNRAVTVLVFAHLVIKELCESSWL